ncbi:hypothetical protein H2248_006579 [Termitomyces sp. 'cryptogamus']|nr:hypothetical protein H2248_006579 [Termitomyces sp. 'cryptogamus']
MSVNPSIPAGYTFIKYDMFVSTAGAEIFADLSKKAFNRNPYQHDIYLYSGFYPYACLNLVDRTIATAHSKIAQKSYEDAYHLFEGLALFNLDDMAWPMCDDAERVKKTDKVYGALVVAALRGLEGQGKLNLQDLPNLNTFLKNMAEWANMMKDYACPASYGPYCKHLGQKLAEGRTPEDLAREKAWVNEWIAELNAENQAAVRDDIREEEKERAAAKEEPKPWYADARHVDEDNLVLSRAWKEYKTYLITEPKGPLEGPSWDISKWTVTQRREFAFDNENNIIEF